MPITSQPPAEPTTATPRGETSGRNVSMVVVGLAVAARFMRDKRTYEAAITVVIAIAAMAGLGKASQAKSFERMIAWDKRRAAKELRKLKPGKRSG